MNQKEWSWGLYGKCDSLMIFLIETDSRGQVDQSNYILGTKSRCKID